MSDEPSTGLPDDASVPDDAASGEALRDDALPDDPAIPDDLSSLTESDEVTVAVVVTQVAAAQPLAAACALARVDVDAVPSPIGALALLRDPRAAADGARAVSQLLKAIPVILLERRSAQIIATRWTAGERGEELPPGLVLSDAPAVLEDLVLGGVSVHELDGVVTSVGMSRWKAMRVLAASARPRR